ncbi:MAG TPA: 16S rRNA (uracil(1498)-N(3))-methyltransferase [Steroidobacteraceae bacterium]|nr:16S rRNA (uracil(1498)-N(3))-methyltransferase [Steroidobacteraceae bacterium]
MRLTRVHTDQPLAPRSSVLLEGAAANHIRRVLRLAPGDAVTLFDGSGGEYEARIEGLRKDAVMVAVGPHRAVQRESPLALTLVQGVSRGERMDLVVQKATELGVRRIVPVLTERTVVRLDAAQADSRLRHWRAVAVGACEQCGRNIVPEVAPPLALPQFLRAAAADDPRSARVVLLPGGSLRVRDLDRVSGLTLLIGPEGGLAELEQRAAADAGFRALSLGPRVLRTETAAIASLAAIQQHLGDL